MSPCRFRKSSANRSPFSVATSSTRHPSGGTSPSRVKISTRLMALYLRMLSLNQLKMYCPQRVTMFRSPVSSAEMPVRRRLVTQEAKKAERREQVMLTSRS